MKGFKFLRADYATSSRGTYVLSDLRKRVSLYVSRVLKVYENNSLPENGFDSRIFQDELENVLTNVPLREPVKEVLQDTLEFYISLAKNLGLKGAQSVLEKDTYILLDDFLFETDEGEDSTFFISTGLFFPMKVASKIDPPKKLLIAKDFLLLLENEDEHDSTELNG